MSLKPSLSGHIPMRLTQNPHLWMPVDALEGSQTLRKLRFQFPAGSLGASGNYVPSSLFPKPYTLNPLFP